MLPCRQLGRPCALQLVSLAPAADGLFLVALLLAAPAGEAAGPAADDGHSPHRVGWCMRGGAVFVCEAECLYGWGFLGRNFVTEYVACESPFSRLLATNKIHEPQKPFTIRNTNPDCGSSARRFAGRKKSGLVLRWPQIVNVVPHPHGWMESTREAHLTRSPLGCG